MEILHLRDRNLTYKAKGLLSFMLSLPEDWDYSLSGLTAISKESRDGIRSILKELQDNNYLEIEKVRGEKGYFEYNYLIYEKPKLENKIQLSNPGMEKPYLDEPDVEIATQINTNKQIDKEDKQISSFFVPQEHNILTLELINKSYISEDDIQIFYYDDLFEQLLNEDNSYKDLIKITHYIIKRVIEKNYTDEDGNYINNRYGYFKEAITSNIRRMNIDDIWEIEDDFER